MRLHAGYRCMVLVTAGVCLAAAARAQTPAPCPPCLHDQMLSSLPADVEVVIAVNNGATQRVSAAGRSLNALIHRSGAWQETTRAWEMLATTLDWTPERTFDELLGRRVSLVMKGLSSPEGANWAVLSEVTAETQRRLRDRLRAAPRGAIAGLGVLSIEDGSFELVVGPGDPAHPDGPSVVLLVPRKSDGFLDELAPALRVRTYETPARVAGSRSCDVVVLMRRDEGGRSLSINASAVEGGWDASVVCSSGLLVERPAGVAKVKPWSEGAFRAIEPGSLLAVMSVVGAAHPLENWSLLPESIRSWPADVAVGAGESGMRAGIVVRSMGPAPAVRTSRPVIAKTGVFSQPSLAPEFESPRPTRLSVTVMTETSDTRSALVKGDQAMARFARLLLTGQIESGARAGPAVQFEIPDQGPRAIRLGEEVVIHPDLQPSISRMFGDTPMLSWRTIRTGPGRGRSIEDGSGWWVASLSPDGTGEREIRGLSTPESGASRERLSMGIIRPAAIVRLIGAIEPDIVSDIPAANFIESLRWDSWLREDGQVEGAVNLRMAPVR